MWRELAWFLLLFTILSLIVHLQWIAPLLGTGALLSFAIDLLPYLTSGSGAARLRETPPT